MAPVDLAHDNDVPGCSGQNNHLNGTTTLKPNLITTLADRMLTQNGQAIPQITNDFNSLPDVGWYGSAYLLTCCAFQLLFGKIYTFYAVKTVFLASILLFEVGSAICGAAPNSTVFIIGRAISGVGAAGIFAGSVSLPLSPPPLVWIVDWCP